jgi:TetR/AcrR family transcriptional repressor of bet genes
MIAHMPRPRSTSPDDLTDALMRVVVERGLDAVSIRTVAREAGVSIGAVQYHFATKDELLLAAYARVVDQVVARAAAIRAHEAGPAAYARALLHELLPLDDLRAAELRVAIAFSARAIHSRRLGELYSAGYQALIDAIADALEQAVQVGEAAPIDDVRRAATQAVAMADGLAWHALCAPSVLPVAEARVALEAHLDAMLNPASHTPPPRHARSRDAIR